MASRLKFTILLCLLDLLPIPHNGSANMLPTLQTRSSKVDYNFKRQFDSTQQRWQPSQNFNYQTPFQQPKSIASFNQNSYQLLYKPSPKEQYQQGSFQMDKSIMKNYYVLTQPDRSINAQFKNPTQFGKRKSRFVPSYYDPYSSKKTSYDPPYTIFPDHNRRTDKTSNYDTSEYKDIINSIFNGKEQSSNNYLYSHENQKNSYLEEKPYNVLDAKLLKIVEEILLREESKANEERIKKLHTVGVPFSSYGVPINQKKIVGVALEPPIKSVLVKEGILY